MQIMEGISVLKEGDHAPEFSAMDHAGSLVKLSDLIGQKSGSGSFPHREAIIELAIVTGTATTFRTSRTKISESSGSTTGIRKRPENGWRKKGYPSRFYRTPSGPSP